MKGNQPSTTKAGSNIFSSCVLHCPYAAGSELDPERNMTAMEMRVKTQHPKTQRSMNTQHSTKKGDTWIQVLVSYMQH